MNSIIIMLTIFRSMAQIQLIIMHSSNHSHSPGRRKYTTTTTTTTPSDLPQPSFPLREAPRAPPQTPYQSQTPPPTDLPADPNTVLTLSNTNTSFISCISISTALYLISNSILLSDFFYFPDSSCSPYQFFWIIMAQSALTHTYWSHWQIGYYIFLMGFQLLLRILYRQRGLFCQSFSPNDLQNRVAQQKKFP